MNIAIRIHERMLAGRQVLLSERRDLHFVVHNVESLSKAKRHARKEFEERNPLMIWLGASFVSQQELKVTVTAKPSPGKKRDTLYAAGPDSLYTSAGRRR